MGLILLCCTCATASAVPVCRKGWKRQSLVWYMRSEMLPTHLRIIKGNKNRALREKRRSWNCSVHRIEEDNWFVVVFFSSYASNQSSALVPSINCITSSALLCVSKEWQHFSSLGVPARTGFIAPSFLQESSYAALLLQRVSEQWKRWDSQLECC